MLNPKSLLNVLPAVLLSFVQVAGMSEVARSAGADISSRLAQSATPQEPQSPIPQPPTNPPQDTTESLDRQVLQRIVPRVGLVQMVVKPPASIPVIRSGTPLPSLADAIKALQSLAPKRYPVIKPNTVNRPIALLPSDYSEYSAVVLQLARIGESAVPEMIRFLQGQDSAMRSSAVDVLSAIGPTNPQTIQSLIQLLAHADADVRFKTAQVLGAVGTPAEPLLVSRLRDLNPRVRAGAAQALGAMYPKPQSALPELRLLLQDKNLFVRGYAAWAIGEFWDSGKPAVPDLKRLLRDPDADVRAIAQQSLSLTQIKMPRPPIAPVPVRVRLRIMD